MCLDTWPPAGGTVLGGCGVQEVGSRWRKTKGFGDWFHFHLTFFMVLRDVSQQPHTLPALAASRSSQQPSAPPAPAETAALHLFLSCRTLYSATGSQNKSIFLRLVLFRGLVRVIIYKH